MSMQHDFKSGAIATVSVGNTSTQILAANEGRRYATIINDSNETVYLNLGAAAVQSQGIRLNANGGTINIAGDHPFRGAVYGICASGSKAVVTFQA